MDKAASTNWIMAEQDERLTETIGREQGRLRNFIRRRVDDESDAEDILQDVFYELIEAYRLTKPIEQVGAWLYRVARNRIIDRFRKKKPESLSADAAPESDNTAPSAGPLDVPGVRAVLSRISGALRAGADLTSPGHAPSDQ